MDRDIWIVIGLITLTVWSWIGWEVWTAPTDPEDNPDTTDQWDEWHPHEDIE